MGEQLTGRELDAAVAEKVMGWRIPEDHETGRFFPHWYVGNEDTGFLVDHVATHPDPVWCPSADISDAWQVVERMRGMGYEFGLFEDQAEQDWTAHFTPDNGHAITGTHGHHCIAICRAALAAVKAVSQ